MSHAYYRLIERRDGVSRYLADPLTEGPWGAGLEHGGPPNALAVTCAEDVVRETTGRTDLTALRLSADFVGPVPVGELDVRADVVRAARSAALARVVIAAGGRDCLHVRVWFVRETDTSTVATVPTAVAVPDGRPALDSDFPYARSLEWRLVDGGMHVPGPAAAWVRPLGSLVDGAGFSGLARTVLIADSASGLGSELDWEQWSFLNVDLDVHLARPVRGEWLLMQARTQLGPNGSALAHSTLSDVHGVVGGGMQTLVLGPRNR